jgi:hypothetical protein
MKRMLAILAATALAGFAQTSVSQNRGMAGPGAVNYVEGQVSLNGQPLAAQSVVRPNQVIDTANGFVEVLLTPGAFLRIGPNSEARLISAGLAGVELEVNRGSAMVEVADLIKGSRLNVVLHGAGVAIEKSGLYSFDATQQSVRVLDGKAEVTSGGGVVTLKKGNQALLASGQPLQKQSFETKAAEHDPLYVWSRVRSEQEAKANFNASNSLAASAWYGPGWYWDPYWSSYAFLGTGYLYSPFGFGYYGYPGIWGGGYGYHGGRYYGHVSGNFRGSAGGFHGGGGHGGGGHR